MLPRVSATVAIPKSDLQQVFDNLRSANLRLVGPTVADGAIVLAEIESPEQLPVGWSDEQQPGRYRVKRTAEKTYFMFNVGPHAWKKFLYPPRVTLFSTKSNGKMTIERGDGEPPRYAFIGVRSCDLQAIAVQDRVLMGGAYRDPEYAARRSAAFIFAVNCTTASGTCFCTSMQSGPRVTGAYDLAATEVADAFVIDVGSEAGSQALENTTWAPANAFDVGRAKEAIQNAERKISREVRTDHLGSLLFENLESPLWKEVSGRCLGCGNCTMVCPTCFCSTVVDTVDLTERTERIRVWDSCHTTDFSHVHGGNVRPSLRARYRQWVTHKFAAYKEQFGVAGCVGCGRCITWCPVGIDITEVLKAFRSTGAR